MKIVSDDDQRDLIIEARLIYQAAPFIGQWLDRRKEQIVQQLVSAHRDQKPNPNAHAELFIIDSMQREIRAKLQSLHTLKET